MNLIDRVLADAIYPQLRGTRDSRLRAEVMRRAGRARAALAEAGYEIVPRTETAQKQLAADGGEANEKGA